MFMSQKIRAALARRMRRIPGVGTVHAFERFSKDDLKFRDMYVTEGRLLGWYIRRAAVRENVFDSQVNRVRITWHMQGYAAVQDGKASELAFDALLDAMRRAFRRVPILKGRGGAALARLATTEGAGLQVDDYGTKMFAGVLCHCARLTLVTEHFEEIEPLISAYADVAGYDRQGNPLPADDTEAAPCAGGLKTIVAMER